MHDIFIAKQPILNSNLETISYELLYRNSVENRANIENPCFASINVLTNAFLEFGMEYLTGNKPAYINLTRELLMQGAPHGLPSNRFVIEVLEDVNIDEPLLIKLSELKSSGYRIALDDFEWTDDKEEALAIADVVKLDVQALSNKDLEVYVDRLSDYSVDILAEKIETHDEFELCKDLGCVLFQGYFLCKPNMVCGSQAATNKDALTKLLAELHNDESSTEDIVGLLSQDVRITYKLLRLLNSAHYNLHRKIGSLHEAAVYLGRYQLRKLVTLILLSELEDKPDEMLLLATIRAKQCELLATEIDNSLVDSSFTVGLFSMLDALLDKPMAELLSSLPVCSEVKAALLHRAGKLGGILDSVIAYERGDWLGACYYGLALSDYADTYVHANDWTNKFISITKK